MAAATPTQTERIYLGPLADVLFKRGLIAGIVLLLASVGLGAAHGDWTRFLKGYLVAFMFVLSIGLGGLFFVIVQHVTRAGWSVVVRRVAEGYMSALVWIGILFIPVVVGLYAFHLFHWSDPGDDTVLLHKAPYLNSTFWLIRAAIFFLIWGVLATFYFRRSVAQDRDGSIAHTHRMQWWAPVAVVCFAVTATFASIDWMKSLEPHWFSTIFGVYFFAGCCCAFFSTLIISIFFLQREGRIENEVTLEHYQDMGKLLFAFGVVFWAYIGFSQFMLIWYANLPEETIWFFGRTIGTWHTVSWFLVIGHFALPFLLLVTKHTKRIKPVIAIIAGWMLFMHYVDLYWIIMPVAPLEELQSATSLAELRDDLVADGATLGWGPHVMDLTLVLGLTCLLVAGVAKRLDRCALVPLEDPRLHESLAFENM